MRIQMNKRMKQLLEAEETIGYLNRVHLVPQLQTLAESKIIEVNGCFFFEEDIGPGFNFERALAQSYDRTGLEHSVSEIYIPGFFGYGTNWTGKEIFAQGYKYAQRLAEHLKEIGHFQVVFSYGDDKTPESMISFHLVRPGERLLSDDIEKYIDQAVLSVDTRDS